MTRSPQLRRLHFLNALFAPLTGHDLYLAQQIDDAIATTLGEAEQRTPSDPAFIAATARLFEKLCSTQPQHGFFHWDAGADDTGASPLFTRAGLMTGLKLLAPFAESTLLVTNLRTAHCPPERRWTGRRQRDYDDSLALIRDLAAARTRRSANLNLLFL
ncbi:hypothetical protein Verru16b_00436 [Lacunisphaera limnophila]|uniref:Uncharacterized protein n=1 Tax=Lacunisphaera limnophila TaxID=1838286 RepID=A0A1D8AR81_9BACT|nr:hypothetical protein [Lacunisphaera limnophila]AOS43393.1 hypothetical protein Verru16b_00436 [Lacunisphaera limnophila]